MSCAGLAGALHRRGHSIALMFRELRQLGLLPETSAYQVYQAPCVEREGVGIGLPVTFADILRGCGYGSAQELQPLLEGWRALYAKFEPDLVVCDFAPTALLAARTMGIRRVAYGNGFFIPPRQSPLPPFRIDEPANQAQVAGSDAAALASVNGALAAIGMPPLRQLAQMFETDEDFLCTFPELDHYGVRDTSGYWGPRLRADLGNVVDFPKGDGKRIFVYVKTAMPNLDALIDVLAARSHRVLAFIPGISPAQRARLAAPSRRVLDRPIRMDVAFRSCDLLVSHGGEIAGGAACAGVPTLLFPTHYEQYLLSLRLRQLGSGLWLAANAGRPEIAAALDTVLLEPSVKASAQAFARRHSGYSPAEQRRRIMQRIEAILAPLRSPATPQ